VIIKEIARTMKESDKTGAVDVRREEKVRRRRGAAVPPDTAAMAESSLHSLQCLQLFKLKM